MIEPRLEQRATPISSVSTAARIAQNSFLCFLAQALDWVLRAIYIVIIARYLSQADFGFYNFAFSLCMILAALSNMGLETLLVREISRDKGKAAAYFGQALLFTLVTMALASGILLAILQMVGSSAERRAAFFLMAIGFFFRRSCQLLLSVPRAYERMEYEIIFSLFEGFGLMLLVILAISLRLGPMGVFLTFCTAYFIEFSVGLWLVSTRFARPSWRQATLQNIGKMVSTAIPMGVASLATVTNSHSGLLLLPLVASETEAGIYGAAFSFIKGLFLIPRSLQVGMLPVFSQVFLTARDSMQRLLEKMLKLILILVLAIAVPMAALARPILQLLYQDKYLAATLPLQIISATIVLLFLNFILINFLYSVDRQQIVGLSLALSLVVSFGALALLGPSWGSVAAALAQLLAEATVLVFNIAAIARGFSGEQGSHKMSWIRIGAKPALAALAMGGILLGGSHAAASAGTVMALLWAPVGLGVYVMMLLALRTFDSEERRLLRALVGEALGRVPFRLRAYGLGRGNRG